MASRADEAAGWIGAARGSGEAGRCLHAPRVWARGDLDLFDFCGYLIVCLGRRGWYMIRIGFGVIGSDSAWLFLVESFGEGFGVLVKIVAIRFE